jgi:hypothetical protein
MYGRMCAFVLLLFVPTLSACGAESSGPEPSADLTLAQARNQLAHLAPPAGTAPSEFEQLRTALEQHLAASGKTRWTAAAPADTANQVTDFYLTRVDADTATAHWTYRNVGDYNQDSQVNISDLTPLGGHLNHSTTDGVEDPLDRTVDGNGDGLITISDITPLGGHLQNTIEGYSVQSTTTPDIELSWGNVRTVLFAESALPAGGGWRTFAVEVPAQAGESFRVVPFHQTDVGIFSTPYDYDGTGGPSALDSARRAEIFEAIQVKFENLIGGSSDAQDQELYDFLLTFPELTTVHKEEGFISAWFTDGRFMAIAKNRDPNAAANQKDASHVLTAPAPGRQASVSVPKTNSVRLLSAFTATDVCTPGNTRIGALFTEAGGRGAVPYLATVESMTVDALHAPQLEPTGVLYIDAHGGLIRSLNASDYMFIMSTATPWAPELDATEEYKEDLAGPDPSLGYVLVPVKPGGDPLNPHSLEVRYAVSGAFFEQHDFELAQDSLVFLNVCSGGAGVADNFRDALFAQGANTILAWSDDVSDQQALDIAYQFFDDALALDFDYAPAIQNPPQRPFEYVDILDDYSDRGISAIYVNKKSFLLSFQELSEDFTDGQGFLRPTVYYAQPTYTLPDGLDGIEIVGKFGEQPGTVYVGGTSYPVPEWNPFLLELPLPPGASGELVVEAANGSRSTPLMLSDWFLPLTFVSTQTSELYSGSVTTTINFNLHLRGCVQAQRLRPSTDPEAMPPSYFACTGLSDSTCTFNVEGSFSDDEGNTTTYEPGGDAAIPWSIQALETPFFYGAGGTFAIDRTTGQLNLALICQYPVRITDGNGSEVNNAVFLPHDYLPTYTTNDNLVVLPTSGSPAFDITGGTVSETVSDEFASNHWNSELTIGGSANLSPPDPAAPR